MSKKPVKMKSIKVLVPLEDIGAVEKLLAERNKQRRQVAADQGLRDRAHARFPKQVAQCTWGEPGRWMKTPTP